MFAVKVVNLSPATGPNMLEVTEFDPTWLTSLLLQADIEGEAESVQIVTDGTWTVNVEQDDDWPLGPSSAEASATRIDAREIANPWQVKTAGWLYAWERGGPPLLLWGDLPLYVVSVSFPMILEYRVLLPAGTIEMVKPSINGVFRVTIDDESYDEEAWSQGNLKLQMRAAATFAQIQVQADRFSSGLLSPVSVIVGETVHERLPKWLDLGLDWFSARMVYKSNLHIDGLHSDKTYCLDLGRVHFHAEIWVKALGWNRYWFEENIARDKNNLVSGLFGPIRIVGSAKRNVHRYDSLS